MAQKTIVQLLDDLTGGEADETLTFGLDGKTYEIDLNTKNATKFRELLEPFAKAGRRTGGRASAGTRGRAAAKPARAEDEPTAEELRTWAKGNNLEVNDRGRVPASIKEAYAAANG
ncbi:Lsr2 family protein [Streptomyces phaeochromogenes]|uniref:histone-like nucleoid-structuring protein Lsr2 n=1 Tax=Streptomyces phaeochromogenes TaxID=1923 RepID=UPI0033FFEAAD